MNMGGLIGIDISLDMWCQKWLEKGYGWCRRALAEMCEGLIVSRVF